MYQILLDYFNNHPKKQLFFINDMILDLRLPEPILSKQLLSLTKKYPVIGTYNRNTGWFNRSEIYHPLKKKMDIDKSHLAMIITFIPVLLLNSFFLLFIYVLIVLGLIMNEVFDNMCYLKDYKF